MATKVIYRSGSTRTVNAAPVLDRKVRVSDSGQFTVSMEDVRELPSFKRDVKNVAQIRQKSQSKR